MQGQEGNFFFKLEKEILVNKTVKKIKIANLHRRVMSSFQRKRYAVIF